jgi:putative nucleotidyltransferase with HDIG domain
MLIKFIEIGMEREEALKLVKENVSNKNLVKHMLAVEAIMKGLAERLGEDKEKWALIGLIHDVDFDKTKDDPKSHAIVSGEILKGRVDEEIIRVIKTHNFENTGIMPEKNIDYALIAADAVSGLIIAAALIIPSKKLADLEAESIGKRYKEKDFARNCSRENMLFCEKIGLTKEEFFEISLKALQSISSELGL